jgi:HPt (histidine-containing phosphotransfer) domain-containing protein
MRKEYSELFTALEKLNVDVNGTVERFVGNDDLYVKFLMEFAETERFPDIYQALENRNTQGLIMLVHKLKGVGGNLGMPDIYTLGEEIIEQLNANSYDGLDEKLHKLEELSSKVRTAIKENKPSVIYEV